MLENFLQEAVQEIEKQTGKDVDLENNTYILQTKSAWLKLGLDDENGEKQLQVHVTGGKVTYLEIENDLFEGLYGGNNDDTTN